VSLLNKTNVLKYVTTVFQMFKSSNILYVSEHVVWNFSCSGPV